MVTDIDLAVAWEWPYDAEFVGRLFARAAGRGRTTLAITRANLETVLRELAEGQLRLRCFLDRAADEWPPFTPLTPLAEEAGTFVINPVHHQTRWSDKARSHLVFASRGIPVPFTVIVPPFIGDPSPPPLPAALGRPFVVKPASGAGSVGVVLEAATVADVQNARRTFWRDHYLLQQRVYPRHLDGRRAWFRVFYVCGRAIPTWWNDQSHVYAPLTAEEEARFGLAALRQVVLRIGRIMGLGFFTTEIVLGSDGRLLCVDYANSPCDMRLQSQHSDGVPDLVVDQIIDSLLSCLAPLPQRAVAGRRL